MRKGWSMPSVSSRLGLGVREVGAEKDGVYWLTATGF